MSKTKAAIYYIAMLLLAMATSACITLWREPEQIQVVKHLPATDEQLASWWFGGNPTDKAALKARICR